MKKACWNRGFKNDWDQDISNMTEWLNSGQAAYMHLSMIDALQIKRGVWGTPFLGYTQLHEGLNAGFISGNLHLMDSAGLF